MDTYLYQAALYCEACADAIKAEHGWNPPSWPDNDPETWPQGPYPDGGGAADTPQHCDDCGVFLRNPLTDDGREYVRRALADARGHLSRTVWAPFYGFDRED